MKTQVFSLRNVGFGVVALALAFLAFTGTASAKTYYHPTAMPLYYGYQQPVYQYTYQQRDREELLEELQSLLAQLERLQNEYQRQYGYTSNVKVHPMVGVGNMRKYAAGVYTYYGRDDYDIDVETERVRNINDDYATLYGSIDLDDAPYAYVWFEYGTDGDLDEDSRKVRVTDSMDDDFSIKVDDLDDDEKYYYRAVAEDPRGDRDYGTIKSFEADDYDDDDHDYEDEPDVETGDADEVTDDSAEINGEVDMNDFDNGDVFFVYGEDEDQVEDVEDEDQYRDIDEDGDDLQKYKVYDNLDGSRTFWLDIYGLDDNTDYYYRICVEYEDEDNDDTLACGDVEHFETD